MFRQLYVITPTYHRSEQLADLTRLMQTLQQVEDLHWIIVEDTRNGNCSAIVANLLSKYSSNKYPNALTSFTLMAAKTPER